MLSKILSRIANFSRIIATVVGIDIEIVDYKMVRLSGTGRYADRVGESLDSCGAIYSYALKKHQTVLISNPKQHHLCDSCLTKAECAEKLTLCTPIVLNKEILGIIGIVCFTEEDRSWVMKNRDVFIEFIEQMTAIIAQTAHDKKLSEDTRDMLDMLFQVTESNGKGIIISGQNDKISYMNQVAKQEFKLSKVVEDQSIQIRPTNEVIADLEEFEVTLDEMNNQVVLGSFFPLNSQNTAYSNVLLIEPKPRIKDLVTPEVKLGKGDTYGVDSIIGDSLPLKRLKKKVTQIAQTSSTVLITGESGTGKEMFARAIHAESDRADKPFVAINCGAIPDDLLESELFGYVGGAFTGASKSGRMGKFEFADNGVLFLDEVGAMPLYLQVKLLRVIQEKKFSRLGSNRQIDVDVRILAATNDNLTELIEQRMFREDLYYRLNVIPLELPPLRERLGDIPSLAEYFLDLYCSRFNKPPMRFPPIVLELMQSYPWPGNIREFENCIEYIVNVCVSGSITPSTLPPKIRSCDYNFDKSGRYTPKRMASHSNKVSGDNVNKICTLAELESRAIKQALEIYGDSVEGKKIIAEKLGIGIATLYRKVKLLQE